MNQNLIDVYTYILNMNSLVNNEDRNVFIYWVGNEYKLIKILRELIYLHSKNGKGYKVHLINSKNVRDYFDVPDFFFELHPAVQADIMRVILVSSYGGIWLDSDTLVLDKLDPLFEYLENSEGFFVKQDNWMVCNGLFGSRAKTKFMQMWKNDIIMHLYQKEREFGLWEMGNLYLKEKHSKGYLNNYTILNGLDNIYPINYTICDREFLDKPYENYKNIIREFQPLIILVNSVYKKVEEYDETEEEFLNGKRPINYFINKSIENAKNVGIIN